MNIAEEIKRLEQKELVLNEFRKERVREDHYNGNNVLCRLAISIKYDSDKERDEIVSLLKSIDIIPEFIIIYQNVHFLYFDQISIYISLCNLYIKIIYLKFNKMSIIKLHLPGIMTLNIFHMIFI